VGKRLENMFHQLIAVFCLCLTVNVASSRTRLCITEEAGKTNLACVCLSTCSAAESVISVLKRDIKVVALSADFRLRDADVTKSGISISIPLCDIENSCLGFCET